jgi:hypothetical protein
MKTLAINAKRKIKNVMRVDNMMIPPSICINNLDMDQRMHDTSVGH